MATSITTWQRLEPVPRSGDLRAGLRAADGGPVVVPGQAAAVRRAPRRGRRLPRRGHALGDDGTAVTVAPRHTRGRRCRRVRGPRPELGPSGGRGGARARVRHRARRWPRRQRRTALPPAAPLPAGRRPGRAVPRPLRAAREDLPGDDPDTVRLRRRAVGRVPDARRLAADLLAHRKTAAKLTSLPAKPPVPAAARPKVIAAANDFLRAWATALTDPPRSHRAHGDRTGWSTPSLSRPTCPVVASCSPRRSTAAAGWTGTTSTQPGNLRSVPRPSRSLPRTGAHDAARAGVVRRHAGRPLLGDRGRHRPLRRSRHRPDGAGADAARRVRADLRQRLVRGARRPAGRLRHRDRLLQGDRLLRSPD